MVFDNLKGTLTCCVRLPEDDIQEAEHVLNGMEASLYEGEMAKVLKLDADTTLTEPPIAQTTQADYEAAIQAPDPSMSAESETQD